MLKSINLQNFALIDKLELNFAAGLHLLSGETGAGKSLLFDALHLLAGQKSDGIWVRGGAQKADLRAEFVLNPALIGDQQLLEQLEKLELQDEENPCVLNLRRIIQRDGRSKAQINGVPVKASVLKQITQDCILFHDQHESMELLKADTQLEWLDRVGGHGELLGAYQQSFRRWQNAVKEQVRLEAARRLATQRQDYVQFQLDEMSHLQLEPEYLAGLEAQLKVQGHATRWQAQGQALITLLGSETLAALRHWLQQVQQDRNPHPKCQAVAALLETALIHLDEAEQDIMTLEQDLEYDEQSLSEAQALTSKVFELSRKHQVRVQDLAAFRAGLEQELAQLETDEERLVTIEQEVKQAFVQVLQLGTQLRQVRNTAASTLVNLLTDALVELGMPATQWRVVFESAPEPKIQGLDDISLLMSSNQGHKPQPLGKIASGGELSRISLILHAYARCDRLHKSQIYCFDEVDVGVSGQVAVAVGNLLRRLAEQNQVFCISHAPQVTAQKGTHWRALKQLGEGQQVSTHWSALSEAERIQEIARMLGTASKPELALAKKLLQSQRPKLENEKA